MSLTGKISTTAVLLFLLTIRIYSDIVPIPAFGMLITVSIIVFCFIFLILGESKINVKYVSIAVFCFAFYLYKGFYYSFQYDLDSMDNFRGFIRYLCTLFIVLAGIKLRNDFSDLCRSCYYYFVIIGAGLICVSFMIGGYKEYQGQMRLAFPFDNPNSLALFSFLCMFILASFLVTCKIKFNLVHGLLSLLISFALLKSGGLTSLCISLFFISLVFYFSVRGFKRVFSILAVFCFISVIFLLIKDTLINRLDQVVFSDLNSLTFSEGSSIVWRFRAWAFYFESLSEYDFLFGAGVGTARMILEKDTHFALLYGFAAPGTHNDYVHILVDFGLIGLIAYLLLIMKIVNLLVKDGSYQSYIMVSFVLSLSIFMVFDNLLDTKFFFFVSFIFSVYISGLSARVNQ